MQNSGEGNIINPVASLLNDKVYAIPVIFIVGWRGEPGIHDEPQHIYQGEVTVKLLEDMDIAAFVIGKETGEDEVSEAMVGFRERLKAGKSVAFVIRKGALTDAPKVEYKNDNRMTREAIIQHIVKASEEDPIVINNAAHETVGGMPTVAGSIDLVGIARACGYPNAVCVDSFEALDRELAAAKERDALSMIEVKCSIGAREDLGRPTTTALDNKKGFMEYLRNL